MFEPASLVDEAVKTAEKIAGYSKMAVSMCKEAVNAGNKLGFIQNLMLYVSMDESPNYFSPFLIREQDIAPW